MKIIGLDLSSSTGISVFSVEEKTIDLVTYEHIKIKIKNFNVNDKPHLAAGYPDNLLFAAKEMAYKIIDVVGDYLTDDCIWYVENTTKGRNRHTTRFLEWLHFCLYDTIRDKPSQWEYIDVSSWRKILGLRMSKEQLKNNRDVRAKKKRGKITPKHLSVAFANKTFGLNLKLKDNDIADSLCIGLAGAKLWQQKK